MISIHYWYLISLKMMHIHLHTHCGCIFCILQFIAMVCFSWWIFTSQSFHLFEFLPILSRCLSSSIFPIPIEFLMGILNFVSSKKCMSHVAQHFHSCLNCEMHISHIFIYTVLQLIWWLANFQETFYFVVFCSIFVHLIIQIVILLLLNIYWKYAIHFIV